jgi:hypothetical protein
MFQQPGAIDQVELLIREGQGEGICLISNHTSSARKHAHLKGKVDPNGWMAVQQGFPKHAVGASDIEDSHSPREASTQQTEGRHALLHRRPIQEPRTRILE